VPALRGSLTYARFFIDADQREVPEDFREKYMRAIRLRAMKPLEAHEDDLERSGWCKLAEPFELELHYEDVFCNEYVALGFRTDRWQIPGPMLKARLREAEAAYLEKKGREKLGRKERAELKESVARKLRKETAPQTRMVDLVWSMNDGIVRFFSHADKAAGNMTELFHKTFGLRLVAEAPYTLAARLGLTKAQEAAWQEIEMTVLAKEAT
jgi:DNA recombination-dependent growth factor C